MAKSIPHLLLGVLALLAAPGCRSGGEKPAASLPLPNLAVPTLGGRQFWQDRWVYAGWRIQENVYTGHSRLLDPADVRRAWGSHESCRGAFETIRQTEGIRPRSRHWVILLHGLLRSRASMEKLAAVLENAGYEAVCVGYPSSRRAVVEHASELERILDGIEDADTVSFVTHSLGGIVVREALARRGAWMERLRVHRLLMLAPPSRGSALAAALHDLPLLGWIGGPAALQLTPEQAPDIPPPHCPFAIIAGGRGGRFGLNPLVPGDDDGVVAVEEARLEGAEDFLVVRAGHTTIMNHPEVLCAAVAYLDTGRFAGR